MRSRFAIAALVVASTVATHAVLFPPTAAVAAVEFVVNSTLDTGGPCAPAPGVCTLRSAIAAANVTAEPVAVSFAIPGDGVKTINLGAPLTINNGSHGITIDGFTQTGSSVNTDPVIDNAERLIELVGNGPDGVEGLIFTGSNNVARGLVLHGFRRAIRISGNSANSSAATNNQILGNVIGLMPDGTLVPGWADLVGSPCVFINEGASRNRIGKPGNANRNVISGCYEKGVSVNNEFTWSNFVQNNLIGLDPLGTQRRENGSMGVDVNHNANGTMIGGTGVQERNVISGNGNSGVEISHDPGTLGNKVVGNYIGTDPTGNFASAATANRDVGVRLEGKSDCGANPCPQESGLSTVTGNVIVNSGWGGILVDKGHHDSTITNNRIGVTLNGTVVGNTGFGIRIESGATHITVGPGNTIVGNHTGIQLNPFGSDPVSTVSSPTQFNRITQNSIDVSTGLGIDIRPYGSVNQNGSGDPNVNERIDVPVLTAQGQPLAAQTCAGCTIELFASTAAIGSFGPGTAYIATAAAGADGVATFDIPAGGWPAAVTATATTPLGSTSEFAQNILPGVASVPWPPTGVFATAVSGSATVFFGAATANGSPVTGYTVTATDLTDASRGGQIVTGPGSPITVSGLTNGDSYTFTVTATNGVGTGAPSAPTFPVIPAGVSSVPPPAPTPEFASLAPARLLDTRPGFETADGHFAGAGAVQGGATVEQTVAGRGGVASNASAVVLNVTVTEPALPGFVTVFPCGSPQPLASNLNFVAGQSVPNAVLAQVGQDGKVCLFTSVTTHLVADVNGYFPSGASFESLVPARVLDTRPGFSTVDGQSAAGGSVLGGSIVELTVAGRAGVPADASGVVLNVTVTEPELPGFVTVFPCGSPQPLASNLNFVAGQSVPNAVLAQVGQGGKVCLFTSVTTHLVADVNGYFPSGSSFVPLVPARLLDTRPGFSTVDGQFAAGGRVAGGSTVELTVAGRAGVPANATAVVLNVTVTEPELPGFVTVFPCGWPQPLASNLNYVAGQSVPNTVIVGLGVDGKVCMFTNAGTHLVTDIDGYFPTS